MAVCSLLLQPEKKKGRKPSPGFETGCPFSSPELCARRYLKPQANPTHLPGPSRRRVVDFLT